MNERSQSMGDVGHMDGEVFSWHASLPKDKNDDGIVSTYLQCETASATHLFICSLAGKLIDAKDYSIGGTYSVEQEDLWFFMNTSQCHGDNFLLKLFVIPRRDMRFSLHLPTIGHNLTHLLKVNAAKNHIKLTGSSNEYVFAATKKDEIKFIKTYRFSSSDIEKIGKYPLLLPCTITTHASYKIQPDVLNKIKLENIEQLNDVLYKDRSQGDFILESETYQVHPVHLIVAAAHSTVLMNAIKNNKKHLKLNMSDEDVELLIEFLYHGHIENISRKSASQMLDMADKMKLKGMSRLAQAALVANINKENAVKIAVIINKYNSKDLLLHVLDFIKKNPELLFSRDIEEMNDIELMRRILQHVGGQG